MYMYINAISWFEHCIHDRACKRIRQIHRPHFSPLSQVITHGNVDKYAVKDFGQQSKVADQNINLELNDKTFIGE